MLRFDLLLFRFGGRQVDASEDDGLINHALVRDHDEDAARLEQFGAELEADWINFEAAVTLLCVPDVNFYQNRSWYPW